MAATIYAGFLGFDGPGDGGCRLGFISLSLLRGGFVGPAGSIGSS